MSIDLKLFKTQIFSIWGVFRIIIESRNLFSKKCFSSNRNYSSCFTSWGRNSKENTWSWDNNFNNFKRRNERHNENHSSSWSQISIKSFKLWIRCKKVHFDQTMHFHDVSGKGFSPSSGSSLIWSIIIQYNDTLDEIRVIAC